MSNPNFARFRAAKEIFKLERCVGVDLSEDMLRVAEELESKISSLIHVKLQRAKVLFRIYQERR